LTVFYVIGFINWICYVIYNTIYGYTNTYNYTLLNNKNINHNIKNKYVHILLQYILCGKCYDKLWIHMSTKYWSIYIVLLISNIILITFNVQFNNIL